MRGRATARCCRATWRRARRQRRRPEPEDQLETQIAFDLPSPAKRGDACSFDRIQARALFVLATDAATCGRSAGSRDDLRFPLSNEHAAKLRDVRKRTARAARARMRQSSPGGFPPTMFAAWRDRTTRQPDKGRTSTGSVHAGLHGATLTSTVATRRGPPCSRGGWSAARRRDILAAASPVFDDAPRPCCLRCSALRAARGRHRLLQAEGRRHPSHGQGGWARLPFRLFRLRPLLRSVQAGSTAGIPASGRPGLPLRHPCLGRRLPAFQVNGGRRKVRDCKRSSRRTRVCGGSVLPLAQGAPTIPVLYGRPLAPA